MRKIQSENVGIGLLLVGFALFLIFYLIPATIVEPTKQVILGSSTSFWMSSRFLPYLVAAMLGIMGSILAISDYFIGVGREKKVLKTGEESKFSKHKIVRVITVMTIVLSYLYLMKLLGYVVASILILAALMYYAGIRKVIIILLTCTAFPLVLYLLFAKIMDVMFPVGIILSGF